MHVTTDTFGSLESGHGQLRRSQSFLQDWPNRGFPSDSPQGFQQSTLDSDGYLWSNCLQPENIEPFVEGFRGESLEESVQPIGEKRTRLMVSSGWLQRSGSSNKLKTIEDLSIQIRKLQTELNEAYRELDKLKKTTQPSQTNLRKDMHDKKKAMQEPRDYIQSHSFHNTFNNEERSRLIRKRSFPVFSQILEGIDTAESWSSSAEKHHTGSVSSRDSPELLEGKEFRGYRSRKNVADSNYEYGIDTNPASLANRNKAYQRGSWNDPLCAVNNCFSDEFVSVSELSEHLPYQDNLPTPAKNDSQVSKPEKLFYAERCSDELIRPTYVPNSSRMSKSPVTCNKEHFNRSRSGLDLRRDSFSASDLSSSEYLSDSLEFIQDMLFDQEANGYDTNKYFPE